MLGHLITELDNRFEEAAAGIVGELAQILPLNSVQLNPSHFKEVLQLYKDNLPLQILSWIDGKVNCQSKQPDTPTKALS